MKRERLKLSLLLLLCISSKAIAKDFGQHGATFEIKEEGFLTMIYRKLSDLDMEKVGIRIQRLAKKRVEEPEPVTGIKRTEEGRVYTYDPTYVLPDYVYLPDGKLLLGKGTSINPLDHKQLQKRLIFIDGRDREQIEWFEEQRLAGRIVGEDRLVLVAGRPFAIEEQLGMNVFFDQKGMLTDKFEIKQVPAIVEQVNREDRVLRVSEIYIESQEKKLIEITKKE